MPGEDSFSEAAMIECFFVRSKKKRYVGFLSNPIRRAKFIRELYHFNAFKESCVRAIEPANQNSHDIATILRRMGAPDRCYAISTNAALDKKWFLLQTALDDVIGMGNGTILSCIPGRLAYFEGEEPNDRHILAAG